MSRNALILLTAATSLGTLQPIWAAETEDLETIVVYGEIGRTDTATKLDLSVEETPQNVTTISLGQMEDFSLTTVNKVLDYTPGVTVEEVETTRTYYTARGFDIVNFQYDGIGIPFISGINRGQQDTAIYEKVQVVKGAAGLITGVANPSATINFIRKRPTDDFTGSTSLTLGQWNKRRVDADVSGALSSSVRGRAVAVYDDSESYLDRYDENTKLGYGILEFDVTDRTLLTVGYSIDKFKSNGVLWGALPLLYTDGSQTDYEVSTNNSPDWTSNDVTQKQLFAELKQEINYDWSFQANFSKNKIDYDATLFYVYGTPDADTELGLYGYAGEHTNDEDQENIDLFFSGNVQIGEQEHQLVVGYNSFDANQKSSSYYNYTEGFPVLGSDWAEGTTPSMDFPIHDPATQAGDVDLSLKSFYLSSRWNLLNNLSVLLGARTNDFEQRGTTYGVSADTDADKTVPYYGVAWEVVDTVTLYSSYSEVFVPQTFGKADHSPLGPVDGESTELGVKKAFNDGRAFLSFGLFKASQNNFGNFIGRDTDNIAVYEGVKYESTGYELELSGELTDGLNIATGFTSISIEDEEGEDARPFIPTKTFDLSATYTIPAMPDLRVGGILKWQNEIKSDPIAYAYTAEGEEITGQATQDAYTLVDLAIHYQATANVGLSLNVENLTDEKYFNSLYWTQAYYAAPRNVSAAVRWEF